MTWNRIVVVAVLVQSVAMAEQRQVDLTAPYNFELAREYDDFVHKHAPSDTAFVAIQRIASPFVREGSWAKALEIYEYYRPLFPGQAARFDAVKEILTRGEEGLVVKNLGPGINTSAEEYNPVPTLDGSQLYFVGLGRMDGHGGEDIYVSTRRDSHWTHAVPLDTNVNTKSHEFVTAVSADGSRLLFLANYASSFGRGDIFYVDRTPTGWSRAQHYPRPVNSNDFDCDGFLTADGNALLFVSDRPGTVGPQHRKGDTAEVYHGEYWGNTDIFVCLKTDTGWSAPINLGPVVNTPYAERTPFLHPDGKTLYFSSSGHPGLGGLDVFKCERLKPDSWTEWSTPVNLGKEINTPGDDWGYRIATAGDIAYFTATGRIDGYGEDDIYSVTLPKRIRPRAVATIQGHVSDEKGTPLEADIKWENLGTGKEAGTLHSHPETGEYFITLPLGANYGYYAEKKGYYPVSKNIDLRERTDAVALTENIVLVSIEQMKKQETAVRLNNIFFEYDRAQLQRESYPELDRVVALLKQNAETKVEIDGHTDNQGSEEYNLDLSKRRAQAVVDYLVQHGCSATMLVAKGFGKGTPVASNDTEEGRAKNRRVEFKFVK